MRVRLEHWQILLDFCEKNTEIITNKFNGPDGKAKGNVLWQSLSQKLNSLGFGEKSKDEWRKALIDWKSKTKAKASKIKQCLEKTGGGPGSYIPLSDLEERLLAIMGRKAIDGDEVPELGFGKVKIVPIISPMAINDDKLDDHSYYEKKKTFVNAEMSRMIQIPSTSHHIGNGLYSEMNIQPITNCTVTSESAANTPITIKRNFSDTRKTIRRVRPKQTERLSHKLIDINQDSLQILRNIDTNIGDIATSLKTMTSVMIDHFSKNIS